jgi:hypothetical protein
MKDLGVCSAEMAAIISGLDQFIEMYADLYRAILVLKRYQGVTFEFLNFPPGDFAVQL